MRYFAIDSLNSMNIDVIRDKAKEQGIQEEDKCTYEQLLEIFSEVFENSKETLSHDLDSIFKVIPSDQADDESVKLSDFLIIMNKSKEKFCEEEIKTRFEIYTRNKDNKME
mmetsp:Transcript_24451/g.21710  ORF Transcript_24451/g.21710 Transcript_24451/m.21710 type:complete len:111 (+) Transcript_24451:400-732(+)